MSTHLNAKQLRGLNKIGDILIPGDESLLRFSKTAPETRIDRILNFTPQADLNDLKMLLTVFAFIPKILLRLLYALIEKSPYIHGPFGVFEPVSALLRLVRLGLRGLVFSLYYSSDKTLDTLGYQVSVYTDDLK